MLRSRLCLLAPLLLVFGVLLAPEAPAQQSSPLFPPASRIGMVPPSGFEPGENFPGFRYADKKAVILLAELPGEAFDTIEKQLSADLAKDTQVPVSRADVTLKGGGKGFILHGRPSGPQGPVLRWTMVARIDDLTALVTAVIPEQLEDVTTDAAIRAAFETVTARKTVPVEEQLAVLPFSMRDLAGFRIVRVNPGTAAVLTDGPNDVINVAEQPLLLVAIAPAPAQPPPNERDSLARRLFGELGGLKDVRVKRSEPLRVAGQQGHEFMVDAKDAKSEEDVVAVQWLRFGTGTLLRIVGIARKDDWAAMYQRFREVRDGIGPK